jgi:hypothetical protein
MGYGKKSDFTNDLTSSPGVSKYNLKTIFDLNQTSRKGFSMYVSRDVIINQNRKFLTKDTSPWIHLKFQDQLNIKI